MYIMSNRLQVLLRDEKEVELVLDTWLRRKLDTFDEQTNLMEPGVARHQTSSFTNRLIMTFEARPRG